MPYKYLIHASGILHPNGLVWNKSRTVKQVYKINSTPTAMLFINVYRSLHFTASDLLGLEKVQHSDSMTNG